MLFELVGEKIVLDSTSTLHHGCDCDCCNFLYLFMVIVIFVSLILRITFTFNFLDFKTLHKQQFFVQIFIYFYFWNIFVHVGLNQHITLFIILKMKIFITDPFLCWDYHSITPFNTTSFWIAILTQMRVCVIEWIRSLFHF